MTKIRLTGLLSVAALAIGLAAGPAAAQNLRGGEILSGSAGAGANFGGARAGGGFNGGLGGGGAIHSPAPMAPRINQAPVAVPQVQSPNAALGGAYGGGYARHRGGGMPGNNGWTGGPAVQHRQAWQGQNWQGQNWHNPNHVQGQYWRGGRHHGRGHWRGGVWVPYVVGAYDYAPAYYDDDECVMRKVRVHTRHGWRRVWRKVCY